jgi:nucleoside-diphosphate-sugar epimerase
VAITRRVAAAVATGRPRGVFVTSSGAARTAATTPYGWLKAASDALVRSTCRDAGVRVLIGRVFAVAGSGNPYPSRYALGAFADAARRGGPVEVMATRPVRRSYTGVADIVALALSDLLLGPAQGTPADNLFETGGEVVEVGDLAGRVAAAAGPGVEVHRPPMDVGAVPDDYLGDPSEMLRLMAVHGMAPASLDELIAATLDG